jgi:hypothetical protein
LRAAREALLALSAAVLALSGCGGPTDDLRSAAGVDAQVLQDVVDATFNVPGPEMLRAMRVQEFDRNRGIVECGGTSASIDGTSNRIDQGRFPFLELIRERGFTEQKAAEADDRRLESLEHDCDLDPDLPSFRAWYVLDQPWRDVVDGVEHGRAVESLKAPMAQCLRERTGVEVDPGDPTTFLRAVNLAMATDATPSQLKRYAVAYSDCGQPYFDKVRTLLLKKRAAFVERNRELSEKFAHELVAAGYVP